MREALCRRLYAGGFMQEALELVQDIHHVFCARAWTLATAESCTGGGIVHRLTSLSGSSRYILGGCVTYSAQSKQDLLFVSRHLLSTYGVVSQEVAGAMAVGVCRRMGAKVGLSVTGYAGPEGLDDVQGGRLCFGLAWGEGRVVTTEVRVWGDRKDIRQTAIEVGLTYLHKHIGEWTL
jgi:PncC family amidohydrolase